MSNFKLGEYYYINKEGLDPKLSPKEQFYYYSLPAFDLGLGVQLSFGSTIDSNKFLVQQETVLISKLNPRIKRVMLVRNDGKYKSISSTEFVNLVPKQNACVDFLLYYLNQDSLFTKLEAEAVGTTNSHVRFKPDLLLKIVGKFPPLPQQRKIAKILITVDNLIEKTEALIAKYQSIKQGMMHDLFTRGVDAKGKLRPPQSEAPELYKQSELGWIPKEWEVETINALAVRVGSGITPTGGSEVYQNEGVIFIRSQNVTYEGLDLSDVAFIEIKTHQLMSNSEVYPFDVLLNITGASIGRCCYLPDGLGRTNTNQHVCCIRLNNSNEGDAKFLTSILGSPIGQIQIYCLNAGGNREGLNYQQLRSFLIPWANIRERHAIANLLMSIESKISKETQFLIKLRLQKTALMQDLLTGKVQVTPDAEDKE